MFRACEYDPSGLILEAHGGRSAVAFVTNYTGQHTLRITEPLFDGIEVGPVYPAGWNIDGTPPATRATWADELAYALARLPPAQARAFVVRVMRRRALRVLEPYREAADSDFGDADLLAEGLALRNSLRSTVQAAAAATSAAELRAAWDSFNALAGG